MDRRLTPGNGRVAATRLKGQVTAERFSDGQPARVIQPVADLLAAPGGARDRQLLFGAEVTIYDHISDHAFIEARADGYVGYVARGALGEIRAATHVVTARATHVYAEPDIKSPDRQALSLGSRVAGTGTSGEFLSLSEGGYIPSRHVGPVGRSAPDPVAVAERLLGTPYLWGGNSARGIDCSGLVQLAFAMAGVPLPGDSDLQQAAGRALAEGDLPERGDLIFWRGHVAIVVDQTRLIHANAHDMAVAYEPTEAAINRIEAAGDGPVTARRRVL